MSNIYNKSIGIKSCLVPNRNLEMYFDKKKYGSPVEQNQQSFLDIYETVISVHSSLTDFLLAYLILTPKNTHFIFCVEVGPY